MSIKNLLLLGGALAGAAYLKDKDRRDRLVGQARGFLDRMKSRATELAGEVQGKGDQPLDGMSQQPREPGAFASPRYSSFDS